MIALLFAMPAQADEPVISPGPAPTNHGTLAAATVEIDAARRLYAQGQAAEARDKLQAVLAMGPDLTPDIRQRVLASLGDLLYAEDGARAAEPFFRALLDENPNYVMDPLEHPPEVSRYLESLRAARPKPFAPQALPKPRGPAPWIALAPGGLYYFGRGEVGYGIAVASSQAALLVTNLLLIQRIADEQGVDGSNADAVLAYQQLEFATNLTAGAFYLSLLLPPAVEFSRWGAEAQVTVGPGVVQVAGRF